MRGSEVSVHAFGWVGKRVTPKAFLPLYEANSAPETVMSLRIPYIK